MTVRCIVAPRKTNSPGIATSIPRMLMVKSIGAIVLDVIFLHYKIEVYFFGDLYMLVYYNDTRYGIWIHIQSAAKAERPK